jgi:alcohol dehydrogenase
MNYPTENLVPAGLLGSFDYQPQTRLVFGVGSLARLGELASQLGGRRALVVTDPGLAAAGHPERALQSLKRAGLDAWLFDQVQENPTTVHVDRGLARARECKIDLLVAVGGGSSMDCAKGINFLFTNGGSMADYKGYGKAQGPMLPSIAVPTTAGTGSEGQSYALIADAQTHMKMACGDKKAAFRAAILDPEVTITQPARVTAITGIDAISHAIESYVCTRRNPLSQLFAVAAWRLLEDNFERVLLEPGDVIARGSMQLGAHFAGTSIENSMLGACHACANPLTAHYGITHGIAIGIMLPHVIRHNAKAADLLYADLGQQSGWNGDATKAAERLAQRLGDLMRIGGLPATLAAVHVEHSMLPTLAKEAGDQWTGQFNPVTMSEKDYLQLYQSAL